MTNHLPTTEELATLSEPEFLELDRDGGKIDAKYDFQRAGIHALGAGGYGTLATIAAFSASPYGALGSVLFSIPAAVCLWKGIQDIGQGVQDAAKASAADTALRILYEHPAEPPGTLVRDAEPAGRVKQLPQSLRQHNR